MLALLVLHEVAVGLILGFLILAFSIVQFAGQLTDVPIGFGMATVGSEHRDADAGVFSVLFLGHRVGVFRP